MLPPRNPQMSGQPAQVGAPQQQMSAPQPQPGQGGPAGAPGAAPQAGPRPTVDIGFNQGIQNVLLARIQAMSPQDQKALDSVITPQTIPVFLKLLPELKPLFATMLQQSQPGPIGQQQPGQPPQGAPGAAPGGPGAGAPPQGGAPSAAQPGGAPGQGEDDEDETDNPLVNNQASSGLVG